MPFMARKKRAPDMEVVTDLGAAVTEAMTRRCAMDPDSGYRRYRLGQGSPGGESGEHRPDGRRPADGDGDLTDGSEQTKTYTLSTGRLKVEYDANSPGGILLPQLAGDEDPWLYGVYAVDETASRFLQWPVQGANTISLSNPYGTPRWQPGGKTCETHTGIDMPRRRARQSWPQRAALWWSPAMTWSEAIMW